MLTPQTPSPSGSPDGAARILIVDDQRSNLFVLRAMLEEPGQLLVEAHSGEEALEKMRTDEFAVVLLDVQMPGLDGFETAKRMRAQENVRPTPIIFLTAFDSDRLSVEEAYSLGAVDYLVKPLLPTIVRAKVAVFVELFSSRQELRKQAEQLREMERRDFEGRLAHENARLISSRQFHRAIADLTTDYAFEGLIEPDGAAIIDSVTEGFEKFYGWTLEEVNARGGWGSIIDPEDHAAVSRIIEHLLAGTSDRGEIRGLTKEGGIKWQSYLIIPIRDEATGRTVRFYGAARDITSDRESRRSLEESEHRFRTLAANVPVGIFQTDTGGNCVYVNEKWCELAGMNPEAARGIGWLKALHWEDRERVSREWYDAAREGREFRSEYRFVTPQGETNWLHGAAVAVHSRTGELAGYLGTVTDITERRRAEEEVQRHRERLELAQTAGRIGTFDWNIQTGAVEWSATEEALFGLPTGGFGGRIEDWEHAVHPDDRQRALADCQQAVATRSDLATEFRIIRPDAQVRWIAAQGRVICDAEGEPLHMVGVNIDVTEQKEADAALRAADRRKDEFLAMLAHELRNPLAPIRAGLDLLAMNGSAELDTIELMRGQVEHLIHLVDDLLDVSRIMRGKIQLRQEPVQAAEFVHSAVATARPLLDANQHKLILSVPEQPIWVHGDRVRLTQVISNLLNNAAKYTESGGRIWLAVTTSGAVVRISVRDSGIGIDEELLPRVFDLFTQADRSLERSQGGLGIGLTVVKSLVEMHGGEVTARSEGAGKGSEFEIVLPVLEHRESRTSKLMPLPSAESLRVLIVDDNRGAAHMQSKLIQKLGPHEVLLAHDGPTAIEAATQFRPQIMLLDIGLPRMNGYDVAKQLRREPAFDSTLLVAVTGYGTEDDQRRSLEAGFDLHFVKPASIDMLQTILAHPKLASQTQDSLSGS